MNFVVTGDRNVGKTTLVKRVVSGLRERGLRPVGFYTDGGPDTLELVPIGPGEPLVFGSQSREFPGGVTIGRYSVNPGAIETGLAASRAEGDVLVIDEIGKLERRGEGFAPLLSDLDPTAYRGTLFSVRNGVVPFVAGAFPDDAPLERLEVTESNREELPDRILDLLVGTWGR
ncbi:MAG: nucleoside-triphosphatase [Halodesulfurarchaeum sp.]|nr:nucleoside-triphosphatase [Halodesulfurarchaeum sp.]